jgi:cytochrome P450
VRPSSSQRSCTSAAALSPRALKALVRAATRQLGWGLTAVSREVSRHRETAVSIPDATLRQDALTALDRKRPNIDGAALFWTLPRVRAPGVLRLLISYQILLDYLDCTSERGAHVGIANGRQLHRAMIEALDPAVAPSDYYQQHPWSADGGYVSALVAECRAHVQRLPSYAAVREPLLQAAVLAAQALALNHHPQGERRDAALKRWAEAHFPESGELAWFEWSAAASAWLTILALLALAGDPDLCADDAQVAYGAYLPWVSLAGTMLDSYADAEEDGASGAHSYIAHYGAEPAAVSRIGYITARALREVSALRHGERHLVLTACMIAMYLSRDSARGTARQEMTSSILLAAGPLPRMLFPVLRAWRIVYGQRCDKTEQDRSLKPRSGRGWRSRLPPAPPAPAVVQTLAFWRDPHAYLAWCRKRYGSRFTMQPVGMAPMVFFSEPAEIRAIVRAPTRVLHPGAGARVIAPLVGEGSFMLADGEAHLERRRAILPAFHRQRVAAHAATIQRTAEQEVARWPRDKPFSAHPYLRALTLRVILHAAFGEETAPVRELHRRILAMLAITGSLALQEPQLRDLPPWRCIWRRFLRERAAVDTLIVGLIRERAEAGAGAGGLLAMLVGDRTSVERPPQAQQIKDDLMSVILAGHETTAAELAWALQLLAHDPRSADLGARDARSGDGSYLAAIVHEVLRHRPVFLFTIPRIVNAPFDIAGSTLVPPTQLIGCIHLMQHDPILYEAPERFCPERFLSTPPAADLWIPWGGGVKRCPGHHLALLEMQIVLRTVLSELRIVPVAPSIERARWRSVIVTPEHGCRIVLHRRSLPTARLRTRAQWLEP